MSKTDNRPNRCQANTPYGQCSHDAVEGQSRCPYHLRDADYENRQALKAYILSNHEIAHAAGRHSTAEQLKSLREEIALCRALVERRLNMIEDGNAADFLAACGQVNTMLLTIEKLVSSCHRLETSLGTLLSKAAVLDLAQEVVGILTEELEGIDNFEEVVDRISERILLSMA